MTKEFTSKILSNECIMSSSYTYDSSKRLIEKMSSSKKYLVEKKYRYDEDRLVEINENTYEGKGMRRKHLGSGRELYHYKSNGDLESSEQFVNEKRVSRTECKGSETVLIYKLDSNGKEYVESELIHGKDFTNDHTYSIDKDGKVYMSGISATSPTGSDIQVKDETGKTICHVSSKKDDSIDEDFPFPFTIFRKELIGYEETISVKRLGDEYGVKMIKNTQNVKTTTKESWKKGENGVYYPIKRQQFAKSGNVVSPTKIWSFIDHPDYIVFESKYDAGMLKDVYSKKVKGMYENFVYYNDHLVKYKAEAGGDTGFKFRFDESGMTDYYLKIKGDDEELELSVDPDTRELTLARYNSINLLVNEFKLKLDEDLTDYLIQIFLENCKVNDWRFFYGRYKS